MSEQVISELTESLEQTTSELRGTLEQVMSEVRETLEQEKSELGRVLEQDCQSEAEGPLKQKALELGETFEDRM